MKLGKTNESEDIDVFYGGAVQCASKHCYKRSSELVS